MDSWRNRLQTGERGPKGNEYNTWIALTNAPELAGKIAYDLRRRCVVALTGGPFGEAGRWTSAKTAALAIWLQEGGLPVKPHMVDSALQKISTEQTIDPLEDYLTGLQWDGQERLGSWLAVYLGAEEVPITSMIGALFLVGMAARALNPGCQMDYALALEGPQGAKKSQVARVLGGEYTAQDLPDFHSKDAQQIVGASWVVEIAEMAAMQRSELEKFKSFMTVTSDIYVPKYERYPVVMPRWCVFIMSVNPQGDGYLTDPTGNRRVWPVTVGQIDIDKLAADRDQLLAEAVHCYRRGDPWWPQTQADHDALSWIQEERAWHDPWSGTVAAWCVNRVGTWTTSDIAVDALSIPTKDINRTVSTRVGIIMKRLGYPKKRIREGQALKWVYEPKAVPTD